MADRTAPYNVGDLGGEARRTAPAVARNVDAIGDVLAGWLPSRGTVLEIASGTGEHALAFAKRFPELDWQPSDPDPLALASIEAWRGEERSDNLRPAIRIDAAAIDWPVEDIAAILCINMVHISPWSSALGLLDGAARLLSDGAPLIIYGPWIIEGIETAPSNLAFDADLKARDPRWGIRSLSAFQIEAEARGLPLVECRAMPANNVMVSFRRSAPAMA